MKEMKDLFQDFDPEERKQMLEDNAYSIKKDEKYTRALSSDELVNARDDLANISIEIEERKSALKEYSKERKSEIKEQESERLKLLAQISYKAEELKGNIYLMDNQEEGIMEMYDEFGHYIGQRPLFPQERQLTLTKKAN